MRVLPFLITWFFVSCATQNSRFSSGFLISQVRLFDTATKDYTIETFLTDRKLWFENNYVIQEIYSTVISRDSLGSNPVLTKKLQYYIFMELSTKKTYHYSSFSDTAQVLESYFLDDTKPLKGKGGWSFYLSDVFKIEDLKYLTDTVIKGINYKRISFTDVHPDSKLEAIGLLRCDVKKLPFQMDKNITKLTGCPMTIFYHLYSSKNPSPGKSEIIYERFGLNSIEKKVFKAWKQNLKNLPVKSQ